MIRLKQFLRRSLFLAAASLLAAWSACAHSAGGSSATGAPQSAAASSSTQTISQTGLLPVFSVDMEIDPSWVDGDAAPSTSPQFSHNGVNDTLDQAWTTLKSGGFNMIRFPLHLDDPKAPVRLANLCLWAKANNITLIPVLQGSAAMRGDKAAMSAAVQQFVGGVVSRMRAGDGSALGAYTQIGYYQIEGPMNHGGIYPGVAKDAARAMLLATADALRQSETQALQGTAVQATPISVSASFDFELIQQGAIAGVALDAGAEQRAQDSLKAYLAGFDSPNIDAINVEWFPRSVSSGDVDHFVTLLGVLKGVLPAKQLALTTGFSSAFNSSDQMLQFYAVTVSNLGNFRASDGVSSNFVGVVFRQAFKGANADLPLPAGVADPSQWNWSDRAQQLATMWAHGTSSPEMSWWVNKVQDNMGLVALQPSGSGASVAALPALQTFQQIATTVTQASQQVQPAGSVPGAVVQPAGFVSSGATQGYVPGAQPAVQAAGSPFQQLMFNLLQQFTQQIATSLTARLTNSIQGQPNAYPANSYVNSSAPPYAPATPVGTSSLANTVWIGPQDINLSTTTAAAGQAVQVTAQLHNQSADQDASGLTVELVNSMNAAAPAGSSMQSGVMVPHGGVAPVQLNWMPDASSTGQVQLTLQVLDSSGQQVTNVAVPAITVAGGETPLAGNYAAPGATPAATMAAQLTVTSFGVAGANSSSAAGEQIPELSAEISNPSQVPTQSGQAQLFLDGAPQQMQTLGPLLPGGTFPLQFSAMQATPGPHNLQLVVTTADGANASATTTANVTQASATTTANNTAPGASQTTGGTTTATPSRGRAVRAVLPNTFRIGTTAQSTSTSSSTGSLASSTTVPPPMRGTPPQVPQPAAANATTVPAGRGATPAMRTITPGSVAATPPSTTNTAAVSTSPRTTNATVRTITPGTVAASTTAPAAPPTPIAPNTPSATAPQNPAPAVRTITPGSIAAATPAATTPAAVPPGPLVANGTPRTITPGSVPPGPAANPTIVSSIAPSSNTTTTASTITTPRTAAPAVRTITPGSPAVTSPIVPSATNTNSTASVTTTRPATPAVRTIAPSQVPASPLATNTTPAQIPVQTPASVTPTYSATPAATRTLSPPLAVANASTPQGVAPASASVAPSSTVRAPGAITARPLTGMSAAPAAMGTVDLAIAVQDIHMVPIAPQAGQSITFTAVIRNLGTAPSQGASVVFTLLKNGQPVVASQPVPIAVAASGAFQASWPAPIPAATGMQVAVTVNAPGDANLANNQLIVPFNVTAGTALPPTVAPRAVPVKPH